MRRAHAAAALLLAACASCAAGASAPAPAAWQPVPPAASADPAVLARNYPASASVHLRLLNRQIVADDRAGAVDTLAWLKARGHVFSAASQRALHDLLTKWGKDAGAALLGAPRQITASAELALIPAEVRLVESAVQDPRTGRLFAASVVSRQLWQRGPDRNWSVIPLADTDSLSGMVIDPRRRMLWIASGDLGMGKSPERAFHGLIGIDLDSLKEVRRISAPAGVNPSDLALGCGGTLYASDPLGGGVYRAPAGTDALVPLVAPGRLRSPQGLAPSADCTKVVVSDYSYGLALIDLNSGQVARVEAAPSLGLSLDGIDGLWWSGTALVAVQNGTSPRRILRLRPAPGLAAIASAQVLEQANPAWSEPLSGIVAGGALIYVGNGQWDRFDAGETVQGKPPLATQVRILKLRTTKH